MAPAAVVVRAARPADAEDICGLHIAAVRTLCGPFYEAAVIDGWLRGRTPQGYMHGITSARIFVAESAGQVVGWGDAHAGEVDAIFVHPHSSRRGVGSSLLARAIEVAESGAATVRVDSTLNATPFYERFGFRVVRQGTQRRNDVDVPVLTMERYAG
jgi:putative acetyltransferase